VGRTPWYWSASPASSTSVPKFTPPATTLMANWATGPMATATKTATWRTAPHPSG